MSRDTLNELQQKQPSNRLIPVTEWSLYHPWPPIGGLRHLVFFERKNGFASAFKRVGKRVLVDEVEFFRIIEAQNQGGK